MYPNPSQPTYNLQQQNAHLHQRNSHCFQQTVHLTHPPLLQFEARRVKRHLDRMCPLDTLRPLFSPHISSPRPFGIAATPAPQVRMVYQSIKSNTSIPSAYNTSPTYTTPHIITATFRPSGKQLSPSPYSRPANLPGLVPASDPSPFSAPLSKS